MSKFYYSSDYAGLKTKNHSFYYGYEETENDEWAFVAKFNGIEHRIPASKLYGVNEYNVIECLMAGIGIILDKHSLTMEEF